ncbi:MAG TPA: acyl-CoA dehydrogenase family protein [Gemmatimonadaceae bacterium]|nr:acyl-CoA dehydrogenase family protein [Gemmatimonadaceae bacterium]
MSDFKPSFTRGIFAGVVHDELLFPFPPSLDKRDPAEAEIVRRLIAEIDRMERTKIIDPPRFDEEETVSEEVIAEFAKVGLLGLTIPKQYGGLELSATAYARVFERISAVDPSLAVLVGVHCGLGSKAIVLYGTDEQKQRYLPVLARGETLAAYALTEPETGSDAQNIKTTARLSEDGTKWILNGHKIWIGNAHRAGVIATFAQTPVERRGETVMRSTAFIIRPDMPGFKVLGTVRKLGIRGSTQAELLYENMEVPVDHMLGALGKGFTAAVNVLNAGRLTLAAGCTSGAKVLVGEMARYAEQRIQFNHPLADFEITQRKLARFASDAYAADAMLGILASLADNSEADFSIEAACAKVFASELIWEAADEMVQIAGGRGFVKPYPYERLLRDARINRIFEGANEVLRLFIALNGIQGPAESLREIGTALRQPLRNLGLLTGFAGTRIRGLLGATGNLETKLHTRLADHKNFFEKHVRELRQATDRAIMRHRTEIVDRQLVLERLANMAIELFATACVISRTQSIIDDKGEEGAEREISLCDLFCVESGLRFRQNRDTLGSLSEATDAKKRTVAADVREAAGYFVSDAILDVTDAGSDDLDTE